VRCHVDRDVGVTVTIEVSAASALHWTVRRANAAPLNRISRKRPLFNERRGADTIHGRLRGLRAQCPDVAVSKGGAVPLKSDNFYRELVERTLRDAGVVEPPVDLAPILQRLGLPVVPARLPAWFKGALIYEDGMPVILLNETISEESRRDATAHLISHLLVRIEEPDVPYPRANPDHRVADAMRDEFRLPRYLVTEQAQRWFNDYRYLARLFAVSEGEMLSRMRELGLVKHAGVFWEY
jgi:hypothetical protein